MTRWWATIAIAISLTSACADRLTAPEAVELVKTLDESLASRATPERWLGAIWKTDLRLGAPLRQVDVRRDGQPHPYQAIVFERVVKPSARLGNATCAGTNRAAYFWRAENDGAVFLPQGLFDQRLVPVLANCSKMGTQQSAPLITASTPEQGQWTQLSVAGDIFPGVVTGACRFLAPDAERVLRDEHGITCELTTHQVFLDARLHLLASARSDSMRFGLDTTAIVGVRYTIDCDVAKSALPCMR